MIETTELRASAIALEDKARAAEAVERPTPDRAASMDQKILLGKEGRHWQAMIDAAR